MTHINADILRTEQSVDNLRISSWTGIKKLSLSTFKTLLALLKYPVNKSSSQRIKTRSVLRKAEAIWKYIKHTAHAQSTQTAPSRGSTHICHILHQQQLTSASQSLISRHLDQTKMYDSSFKFNSTKLKAAVMLLILEWYCNGCCVAVDE